METNELHRGRLIDHLQLVVSDLARSKRFCPAVFAVLGIAIGGEGPGFFWADEVFVSDLTRPASAGATQRLAPTDMAPSRVAPGSSS